MSRQRTCALLSFDYLDYDVFLNARAFYRLAGFNTKQSGNFVFAELLVILRGLPPCIYAEFQGCIHYYDYVREHSIDIRDYFPNASSVKYISIAPPVNLRDGDQPIYGYLPIVPWIWQFKSAFVRRSVRPVHIANYKPLNNDPYQQQLISLAKSSYIRVYGSKWDKVQLRTRPLSYFSANRVLSHSYFCYGLMYPYQRGLSLSGRMWQAPIQGCIVISEMSTNIFSCPGVYESPFFERLSDNIRFDPEKLSLEATNFWWTKTLALAEDLDLSLNLSQLWAQIFVSQVLLLSQHIEFLYQQYFLRILMRVRLGLRRVVVTVVKSLIYDP